MLAPHTCPGQVPLGAERRGCEGLPDSAAPSLQSRPTCSKTNFLVIRSYWWGAGNSGRPAHTLPLTQQELEVGVAPWTLPDDASPRPRYLRDPTGQHGRRGPARLGVGVGRVPGARNPLYQQV